MTGHADSEHKTDTRRCRPTLKTHTGADQAQTGLKHTPVLADLEKNPVTARTERVVTGKTWYGKKEYGNVTVYDPKPIPKFTETAPALPAVPVAPEIEKFDEGEFGTKRAAAESTFKREVGERRAAKIGAVSRKMTRPLLAGE